MRSVGCSRARRVSLPRDAAAAADAPRTRVRTQRLVLLVQRLGAVDDLAVDAQVREVAHRVLHLRVATQMGTMQLLSECAKRIPLQPTRQVSAGGQPHVLAPPPRVIIQNFEIHASAMGNQRSFTREAGRTYSRDLTPLAHCERGSAHQPQRALALLALEKERALPAPSPMKKPARDTPSGSHSQCLAHA